VRVTAIKVGESARKYARTNAVRRPNCGRKTTGNNTIRLPNRAGANLARALLLPNKKKSTPVSKYMARLRPQGRDLTPGNRSACNRQLASASESANAPRWDQPEEKGQQKSQ
jgi:hypothetical protein